MFLFAFNTGVRSQGISEELRDIQPDSSFHHVFKAVQGDFVARPFYKPIPKLYFITLPAEEVLIEQRADRGYSYEKRIHNRRSGMPGSASFRDYALMQRQKAKEENWKKLITEFKQQERTERGLLDFRLAIPGGRESAFTTIFGEPEVNLRVNGVANMNAGASIQLSEDPNLPRDQQTRVDPTFDQNLQLNIQGNIGDKLSIQTDWDTERPFEYQNRLSIVYEGYDDEIIKTIEMGNVTMNTGNSLVRGSGALFGIKSVVELGSLRVTSVVSQQDGESNVETIRGGSQEQPIEIRPADYSDDRHFFLDFYTRQEFETSMENPQQLRQTLQIADVEVWILRENIQTDEGSIPAVALAEIGVVEEPDGIYAAPDNEEDTFTQELLDPYRDPQTGVSAQDLGVEDSRNFEEGYFTPLREGEDYTINKISGFISMRSSLGSREVLAVSYTYRGSGGELINVGEMNRGGGDRIFLKMLRPKNVSTENLLFPLTMRNIYSLGMSNINRESIELELLYTEDNLASDRLPGSNQTLIQDLGLDRVDSQGALESDNQIDFGTGTLDAQNGLIVFPYLEPFGSRINEVLQETGTPEEEVNDLSYTELYSQRQRNAAQSSKNGFYQFRGTSRGGVQDNYSLGFALVEGSVKVFANGSELQEDVDYQVDYSFGSITLLNDRYTAPGQDIRIEYENQALTSIEQKTFTGIRAEYELMNNVHFGGTWFRFSERPLDDKIRIGDEPISNSILGFDANARFDAPFLTRTVDALPLVQTRAPSEFEFSGEFAQLRPGISQTRAVNRAIRNNELFPDEEEGLSFIDDFEGANIKINLLNATRWHLASAPAAVPGFAADGMFFEEDDFPGQPAASQQARRDRSDLRSKFSWYTVPRNITSILDNVEFTPESEPVEVTDVFPGRETRNPQDEIINTLDVFYNPRERGQYNYNSNLRGLLEEEPQNTWGGMTSVIPSGQEDFTQNNIEFLEFWVQPVLPGGEIPNAASVEDYDGKIYIDIGIISEDVIPNSKLNTEDGLALNTQNLVVDDFTNPRSALSSTPTPPEGQFSNENRELEDVGLDGLPNSGGVSNLNELSIFSDFIEEMREQFGSADEQFQQLAADPSNDDYVFYGESKVQDLPLHERFHRMLGFPDGNTPLNQDEKRASTNRPNTEGLVNSSSVELTNAYFQYEVDLNPADETGLEIGSPGTFIVDRVPGTRQQDRWYQVRIPLDEFIRQVGDINDFQNISYIRIWMSGYSEPFTLRFAALEFVGSQWRNDESINQENDSNAELKVSTINIEENANRKPVPYRQPAGGIRGQNRGSQLQSLQNEQSIILNVQNLNPGAVQMVKRVYPGGLNLLDYSNMRMFVHGEGFENRGDAELVLRFGNDLENNYYEYRQPVTPSNENFPFQLFDPTNNAQLEEEASRVWIYDENSMNIVLSAFNQLKQLRDQDTQDTESEVYERADILPDAVPGAVVAIKGNPSLGRVTEVGMGIRNPFDPSEPGGPGTPVLNAELWLNELRVSGFDNEKGWAANAKSTLKLADFATVNANVIRQTQGFGSLDSRLGQRRISNELAYDLNTSVNLDSFIPDRYGWSIPFSFSTRRSTSVPKYLPNQGDIRLSDFENAVRSRDDLNADQQNRVIQSQIRDVESYNESYSFNLSNVTKSNSENPLARYILDNTTLNYVYNSGNGRNPEYRFQNNWNYNAAIRYNLAFRNVRFIRPFRFLEGVPLARAISGFQLGYMPNNITTSFTTRRSYEDRKRRTEINQQEQSLQQTHSFAYNTNFGFGYNLTRSISTTFQARGTFDLARIAARDAGLAGADSSVFVPTPSFSVFRDILADSLSPRRSNYEENYTASWQPQFSRIDALSWLNYNPRYSGGYRWENSPFGSNQGARVSNTFRLDHTIRMNTEDLLNRIPFYERAAEMNREETNLRQQRNNSEEEAEPYSLGEHMEYYGRKIFLAVFSMRSIDINYNNAKTSAQAGYAGGSQLYDFFSSDTFTPSFGYRLGLQETIGRDQLINNVDGTSSLQLPGNNTYSDNITWNTTLNPFQNVAIDLNWQTQWDERSSESLALNPDNTFSSVRSASGNITSSVWAFGPGYETLYRTQLQIAFDDMNPGENTISDETGNMDGRTVLNKTGLQEDFRQAYLGGRSSIGKRNFMPFPLPGWRVNWTGIEGMIPFIGEYMQRATLVHAYTGLYRTGWNLNNDAGEPLIRRLGSFNIEDTREEFEPASVTVEKRFSPLVQLNITWDNGLRTQAGYETSKITSLALSNTQVTERLSKGLRVSIAYTLRNFRLPLIRRTTNNIDLTLNGSFIEDTEQHLRLETDLQDVFQRDSGNINPDPSIYSFTPGTLRGQSRINTSAVIGYRFSSTIQANVEYSFSNIIPKSSGTFKRTTHDVRFSVRINIRST